ncbi:MAG: type II toxin-antitoxin system HicB family antitoxin [Nitrospira sp.]|nr:type II toxin-antitoxin system HicB family antitoxin [Nitrospira sp.]
MKYRIALHKSEEGFAVSVPGLPGCWSQGTTEQEAIQNIRDATRECLAIVENETGDQDVHETEVSVEPVNAEDVYLLTGGALCRATHPTAESVRNAVSARSLVARWRVLVSVSPRAPVISAKKHLRST